MSGDAAEFQRHSRSSEGLDLHSSVKWMFGRKQVLSRLSCDLNNQMGVEVNKNLILSGESCMKHACMFG